MNAFSLNRKLFRVPVTHRDLPLNINVDSDGIGIVVGNDVARVINLTFRLKCLRSCKGSWHGKTLRELAWDADPRILFSTADYSRLMSQVRRGLSSDLLGVHINRKLLPKTDRFLEHRLRPTETPNWNKGPGARVISRTDVLLQDLKSAQIDDIVAAMLKKPKLPNYKRDYFYERSTIVAVVSGMITNAEQSLLAQYLKDAEQHTPHVNIVLVVDDAEAWSRIRQNPEWSDWATILPTPVDRHWEGKSSRYKLGHVSWPTESLDGQIKRVVNLARRVICDGGEFTDISVTSGDYAMNLVVRQKLLDIGVPIQNSESHLLPMRPQLLTLMTILSVANGIGRVQGLRRLLEVWPRLDQYDFETTFQFFERLDDWPDNFERLVDYRVAEFMNALKPIRRIGESGDCRVWMDAALATFDSLPKAERHENIRENADAAYEWGRQFKRLDDMLCEFWRLRAVYSDWQGFKYGSGISVANEALKETTSIVVVLQDESGKNAMLPASENVYFAPVANHTTKFNMAS